jgi:hypothetical protein
LLVDDDGLPNSIQISLECDVVIDESVFLKTLIEQVYLFQQFQIGFAKLEGLVCCALVGAPVATGRRAKPVTGRALRKILSASR